MPRQHLLECRIQLRRQFGVAAGTQILLDRDEEPQAGIDRVVFRDVAGIRKAIRQHALAHKFRKGAHHARGNRRAPGGQRQAPQGDHRVAAPVTEPGIAGDDRHADGLSGGIAPLDQELVGRQRELLQRCRIDAARGTATRVPELVHQVALARALLRQRRHGRRRVVGIGREYRRAALPRPEIELEACRAQQVLEIVEAPGGLLAMSETPIPLRLDPHCGLGAEDAIRTRVHRALNLDAPWNGLDAQRLLAARLPVVVAIRAQGINREVQILGSADAGELHVGCVLTVPHPEALLETRIREKPGPHRDQALEPE